MQRSRSAPATDALMTIEERVGDEPRLAVAGYTRIVLEAGGEARIGTRNRQRKVQRSIAQIQQSRQK